MERLHTNQIRDLTRRLQAGESERRSALDRHLSRPTVHKYYIWTVYFDPIIHF